MLQLFGNAIGQVVAISILVGAGLPALFQILDSADQLAAIKRLLKNLNVDDEKFPPRELQHFINDKKEAGLRPAAV